MFQPTASRIMTEAEIGTLIDFVARNPMAGDVMKGAGGLRQLRWRLMGRGKRGGARIIYYVHDAEMPLYLPLAYSKSSAADVSAAELRRLMAITAEVLERRREKRRT